LTPSLPANYQCNHIMKKKNITSVFGVIGLAGFVVAGSLIAQEAADPAQAATPPVAPPAPALTDAEVKTLSSYLLGFQSSQRFGASGLTAADLDMEQFEKGFMSGLKGEKPMYSEDQIRAAMGALGELVQDRQAKAGEKNLAAGKAFLAENGKREGVTTTASGLQYEVLHTGGDKKYVAPEGDAPDNGTRFMVHYRGTLIDGTEFDKSPEGQTFPMTLQVIPGFKEALTTMPVGAKWKIFLPAELAYGARQAGPKIGANSALIFELELVDIQKAPAPAPGGATPPVQAPPR
jgi:FKBP-type peptidyl-prolyl cis-trans isomerase